MRKAGLACIALVMVAAAAGCSNEPAPPPVDLSCEGQPDPHCAHPIDRLLIPRLRALGVPIRDGGAEELCRRMAIDLAGRGPTRDELLQCRGQTPEQMFETFATHPDYLREQRRAWGERFEYDIKSIWSPEIVDLDLLAGAAYAGSLDYSDFAARAAMHPAFYGLHPGDSWTAHLWSIFLGRPARADEIEAMRPLTRPWTSRGWCDGAVWWSFYKQSRDRGIPEPQAMSDGDHACTDVAKSEWGFNLCACRPGAFGESCAADALGRRVELTAACANPGDYNDPANFVRASDRTPGDIKCPNGTQRPECKARLLDPTTPYAFLPFQPWAAPPPQLRAELGGVGAALAARGDFWEAAADRELRKLLGWWQATFRHPDSDLPEVRARLAEELRAGGSLRELQKRIVTSLLYTQPGAVPAIDGAADMPPWIAGPTKLLAGEAWLVTAAAAVGEVAGRCDFRWVSKGQYAPLWADLRLVDPVGGTLDKLTRPGYSLEAISRLSGCSTTKRPTLSDIGLTYSQAEIAYTLCAYGTGVVPEIYNGGLAAATVVRLISQIWNRSPLPGVVGPGEVDQMLGDMTACNAAGAAAGCGTPESGLRWLCQRMIDSAEFATY